MKKLLLKTSLMFCISLLWVNTSNSQIFFNEDFQGTMGANGLPTGWTESGLATDGIYDVGDDAMANSAGYWPVPTHTLFAQSNDDACNCDKSEDRLILPVQDFSTNTGGIELIADFYMDGNYSASGFIEVSTDAGGTWTVLHTMVANAAAWQDNFVQSLNAYVGAPSVLIAFRFDDQSAWSSGLAVDNVRLNATVASAALDVTASFEEYTLIPLLQTTAMDLNADVASTGTDPVADAILTANVYLAPDFVTPVFTASSAATPITAGANAILSAGSFTPSVAGDYLFEYIATSTLTTDDTLGFSFGVTNEYYARDNGNVTVALGLGAGTQGTLGSIYTVVNDATLDSVSFYLTPGVAGLGDTVEVVIGTVVASVPTGVNIGSSGVYILTAADTVTGGAFITLPIVDGTGNSLILTAGDYFVGVEEYVATDNYGLAMTSGILTAQTSYGSINNGVYTELAVLGFDNTPVIRPAFSCVPLMATDVQASCGAFTWIDGNTYTTSNNTATFAVPNPGACDSVFTLDLTVTPLTATDVQTSCGDYVWIDGNTYTVSTDSATFVVSTGACDTLITLDLTVTLIDLTTTTVGATITSNDATATYQWIDCATNTDIAGETSQAFTATVDGDYAVVLTNGTCSDTSACEAVMVIGLDEDLISIGMMPNPTNNNVTISFNAGNASLTICDAQGKVIIDGKDIVSEEMISLRDVEKGIYFFHFVINGQESVHRVVKN